MYVQTWSPLVGSAVSSTTSDVTLYQCTVPCTLFECSSLLPLVAVGIEGVSFFLCREEGSCLCH